MTTERRRPPLVGRASEPPADDLLPRHSAVELEALRAESTAVVAHDMRTPIQTVLFHAEALLRRDASRIESGHLGLRREVVDLPETLRSVVERLKELLGGRTVSLTDSSLDVPSLTGGAGRLPRVGAMAVPVALPTQQPRHETSPSRCAPQATGALGGYGGTGAAPGSQT